MLPYHRRVSNPIKIWGISINAESSMLPVVMNLETELFKRQMCEAILTVTCDQIRYGSIQNMGYAAIIWW